MDFSWKEISGYLLLALAGGLIYVIFEEWWKGLLFFVASILIDIGVDHIMLKWEKARGEVD